MPVSTKMINACVETWMKYTKFQRNPRGAYEWDVYVRTEGGDILKSTRKFTLVDWHNVIAYSDPLDTMPSSIGADK